MFPIGFCERFQSCFPLPLLPRASPCSCAYIGTAQAFSCLQLIEFGVHSPYSNVTDDALSRNLTSKIAGLRWSQRCLWRWLTMDIWHGCRILISIWAEYENNTLMMLAMCPTWYGSALWYLHVYIPFVGKIPYYTLRWYEMCQFFVGDIAQRGWVQCTSLIHLPLDTHLRFPISWYLGQEKSQTIGPWYSCDPVGSKFLVHKVGGFNCFPSLN